MRVAPRSILVASSLFVCALAAGCGSSDSAATGDDQNLTEATLTFGSSFGASASSPLRAGTKLRIHYAPERLPQCRMGLNDGSPGWTITGFASIAGREPQSFYVAGHSADPRVDSKHPPDATIDLKSGGDLAIWFQVTNAQGCSAYDSDFGKNFHFDVKGSAPADSGAIVSFPKQGDPISSGRITAGSTIQLVYDAERLGNCRMGLNDGRPGWTITGFSSTNGKPAKSFYVSGFSPHPTDDPLHPAPASVDVEEEGELSIWFQVTNGQGCSAFDSAGGRNYRFSVGR